MNCTIKHILRVLTIDTAIALISPILNLVLNQSVSFHHLLVNFGYSLVYSHAIGSLAFATLPKVWPAVRDFAAPLRWLVRAMALFAVTLIGAMIACLVFVALGWVPLRYYWVEFTGSLKIATFVTVLIGSVISMYETMRGRLEETTLQLRTKELEREHALKLATEAQLASLESRIHPHFLFNTLNSISALIPEDPKRAEKLVEQMAALLRFSLDSKQSGLVPLANEMKVVTDYLEIERARFGERLRYRIDLPFDLSQVRVPPLSVQTLVENSVKYAVSPSRPGGEIQVTGARQDGLVNVEVSDTGPGFQLDSVPAGHGLDNLRSRLTALFGEAGKLTVMNHDNRHVVMLSIPQSIA